MDRFRDVYMPDGIQGFPCRTSPRFSTKIDLMKSGDEAANKNWDQPLRRFVLPEAVADQADLNAATDHWLIVDGPFHTFPFRDPHDFASCPLESANVEPDWTGLDQPLGVGNGQVYMFNLAKTYTVGPFSHLRPIYFPVLDDIEILIDGLAPGAVGGGSGGPYSVVSISRPGGLVTISPAPTPGRVLTWGGLFDVEVRWEGDDAFDAIAHSFDANGVADINLVETRRC